MVLFSHSRNDFFLTWGDLPSEQQGVLPFIFYTLGRLGHEAVVVFFVLSGFLVGGRGLERIADHSFQVKSYAIDRFARIYPPLIAAIILYFITCQFVPGETWSMGGAIGNILNLQGICCEPLVGPFWSLSLEVWFYIVLALIGCSIMAKSNSGKIISFALLVASCSLFVLGFDMHYLLIWFLGAMAYLSRPLKKSVPVLICSLIGIVVFVGLWQISTDSNSLNIPFKLDNPKFIEIGLSLMMCLLVQQLILIEPKSKISKFFESGIGRMACFSYTLYLSHRIILKWFFYIYPHEHQGTMSIPDILIYCLVVVVTMFLCWALYLLSEKHTPEIKKYLKYKLNK